MGCLGSMLFMGLGLFFIIALVLNFVLRLVMSPLSVPQSMLREHKRERNQTMVLYCAMSLWMLGMLLLPITYLLIIWWHFREKRGKPIGGRPGALPWIPRVSLAELLAMAFSIGACPLLAQWQLSLVKTEEATIFLVLALITFPLCFLCAYMRMDSNRVPLGWARMTYLFLFPYAVWAVPLLGGAGLALLFASSNAALLKFVAVPVAILIAGVLLSYYLRRLASEAAQAMPPVISGQLEEPQSSDATHR